MFRPNQSRQSEFLSRPVRRGPLRYAFDTLAWCILVVLLLYLDYSLYWMLLIVPAWVLVRVLRFRKRCIDEGLW